MFVLITSAALAGCASVEIPDAGEYFRDYPLDAATTFEREPLPVPPYLPEEGSVVLTEEEVKAMVAFVYASWALEDVLEAREDQIRALEEENAALVGACVGVEKRLELVSQMYENDMQECRAIRFSAYGIAGISFLLLGIGSL